MKQAVMVVLVVLALGTFGMASQANAETEINLSVSSHMPTGSIWTLNNWEAGLQEKSGSLASGFSVWGNVGNPISYYKFEMPILYCFEGGRKDPFELRVGASAISLMLKRTQTKGIVDNDVDQDASWAVTPMLQGIYWIKSFGITATIKTPINLLPLNNNVFQFETLLGGQYQF